MMRRWQRSAHPAHVSYSAWPCPFAQDRFRSAWNLRLALDLMIGDFTGHVPLNPDFDFTSAQISPDQPREGRVFRVDLNLASTPDTHVFLWALSTLSVRDFS